MSLEYEKFSKPKPPAFPFRIDVRPENHWKLDDSDFQDVLEKNIELQNTQTVKVISHLVSAKMPNKNRQTLN